MSFCTLVPKFICMFRLCKEGHLYHIHSFGCGDTRGEKKAFGSLCMNFAETQRACSISSPLPTNAPRDICYPAYGEVILLERSPEWFCVLDHLYPCTLVALLVLWPSPLISFLKVMAALSAFVLLLPVIVFYRPFMPLISYLVFVCLDPRWNLCFLNLRNKKYP